MRKGGFDLSPGDGLVCHVSVESGKSVQVAACDIHVQPWSTLACDVLE